ncbi:hypothetical protein P7L53_16020 [Thermoleptolyngbya sichuanensis XZ-Cy5]|nr:hypothetical protein [Thermoleptolyngbya sichuanensis XZ-Cy5]
MPFDVLEARVDEAVFRKLGNVDASVSGGPPFRAILDVSDEPSGDLDGAHVGQARLTFPERSLPVVEGDEVTTVRLGVAKVWRVVEDPRRLSDGVLVAVLARA